MFGAVMVIIDSPSFTVNYVTSKVTGQVGASSELTGICLDALQPFLDKTHIEGSITEKGHCPQAHRAPFLPDESKGNSLSLMLQ